MTKVDEAISEERTPFRRDDSYLPFPTLKAYREEDLNVKQYGKKRMTE